MNLHLRIDRISTAFAATALLLMALVWLMKSSIVELSSELTLAITVDLIITVPIIYLLLIYKTKIPKTTAVPVMILGLILGSYFLPAEGKTYLSLFTTWGLPVIEISVLTFITVKVVRTISKFRALNTANADFFSVLKHTCYENLPKVAAMPLATEMAVVYYAFINWRKRPVAQNEFTYHKESGTPALLGAFVFIIIIEALAIHLLIANWSTVFAWVLTGLSFYTGVQIIGFAKALSKRPIAVNENTLTLRYGILNEAEINFEDIDSVELSGRKLEKDKLQRNFSPFGEIESHNTIIHLKRENELVGFYGMRRGFRTLALHVDKPRDFKTVIDELISAEGK